MKGRGFYKFICISVAICVCAVGYAIQVAKDSKAVRANIDDYATYSYWETEATPESSVHENSSKKVSSTKTSSRKTSSRKNSSKNTSSKKKPSKKNSSKQASSKKAESSKDTAKSASSKTENSSHTYSQEEEVFEEILPEEEEEAEAEEEVDDSTSTEEYDGIVNINTATLEELCSLNGIGEVLAQRIIDFREESGEFSSIEEIMYVSGIAEGKFQGICDRIVV